MIERDRSLATVLFTDIVGSTERAAELRDAGWRDLRQEHDRRVRRELRRFGGREINTAGDSFLVTFERPARGIACAAAIRAAVRELGLEIRAGLHMGELEGARGDLGGLALNIGARVAAEAGPGEILVSRSVHDALAGSAFDFEDRGVRALKGVPGEWRLFAVTNVSADTYEVPSRGWLPEFTARHIKVGAGVLGLLALGWAIHLATRDSSRIDPEAALAAGAAPGIAVLPFQVADPNLAVWREGIVDLLTTNLDGVGGLRTIDSRTVLAQWHEGISEGQVPDLRTILKIAREAGGSYAVVGSAVTIGPNVRLSADVYELARGRAIGAARAEGPPDSLYPLVDRLSLEVVRAILKEDADKLPSVPDLASVTTTSFPALKAYLEGEALYRKAAYENAIAAYRRAVEADSTFALAWLGLAEAEWPVMDNREIMDEIDQALALSDNLPQRGVMLANVYRPFLLGDPFRTRELAQEFVHFYPDSPEGWWLLARTFLDIGVGSYAPGDPADGERALLRAVKIDPSFVPAWIDLLQVSFSKADREQVADCLEALTGLGQQDGDYVKAGRLAYAIGWGDSTGPVRAWAAVDTLSAGLVRQTGMFLNNGRFLPITETLYRETLTKLDKASICVACLTSILFWEGKFEEVIRLLDHPLMPPPGRKAWPYHLHFRGAALPDSLDRALGFQAADTTLWFLAGAHAADRGRWPEHATAVQAFRTAARQAGRDSVDSRAFGGAANALEGYGLWKQGRGREALPLLIAGQRDMVGPSLASEQNALVCRWTGQLLLELGKPAEAVPYLQVLWPGFIFRNPFGAYDMGRAYAELGENRKAAEAYQEALLAWRSADPVLRPRIETARREIARLRGSEE